MTQNNTEANIANTPSKLIDGNIPANTICPFRDGCGFVVSCHHKGIAHEVAFSCASARAADLLERHKAMRNATTPTQNK